MLNALEDEMSSQEKLRTSYICTTQIILQITYMYIEQRHSTDLIHKSRPIIQTLSSIISKILHI